MYGLRSAGTPFVIGYSRYIVGLPRSQWIVSSRDRYEFPPYLQRPLTFPLHSPNDRHMPVVRAVQRRLWKSLSATWNSGSVHSPHRGTVPGTAYPRFTAPETSGTTIKTCAFNHTFIFSARFFTSSWNGDSHTLEHNSPINETWSDI